MSLNLYRDEVARFMKSAGFNDDGTDNLVGMLEEEFEMLKSAKGDTKVFQHQIYDMMFLLFSLAVKTDMNIDAEWASGRERKKKYSKDKDENTVTTYNKLVRDRIPEVCSNNGLEAITRVLKDEEYQEQLAVKLREECDEYIESRELEELADVLEVLHAISVNSGQPFENIEKLRIQKEENRGAFKNKLLLLETRRQTNEGERPQL